MWRQYPKGPPDAYAARTAFDRHIFDAHFEAADAKKHRLATEKWVLESAAYRGVAAPKDLAAAAAVAWKAIVDADDSLLARQRYQEETFRWKHAYDDSGPWTREEEVADPSLFKRASELAWVHRTAQRTPLDAAKSIAGQAYLYIDKRSELPPSPSIGWTPANDREKLAREKERRATQAADLARSREKLKNEDRAAERAKRR
jgi:hypothetical protein